MKLVYKIFCLSLLCTTQANVSAVSAGDKASRDTFISEWGSSDGRYVKIFKDRESGTYKAMLFAEMFANADPVVTLGCTRGKGHGATFEADGWKGILKKGVLTLSGPDGITFKGRIIERVSPTLGMAAPQGADVLFDGTSLDAWLKLEPKKWTEGSGEASESAQLLEEGAIRLVPREKKNGSIISKKTFSDFRLHAEFRVPEESQVNGGVYLLSKYEINIKDTFGQGKGPSCCSFGNVSKPSLPQPAHNYALPPMVWQTLDVEFYAPRFDDQGNKISDATATVWFNGEKIYDAVRLEALKGAVARSPEHHSGPIYLQEHGVSYDFRNIWVLDLTK